MFRRVLPFLTLFSSLSTLVCCALPALFVSLGFGASLVAVLGAFPQLIWLSAHKGLVFILAGTFLSIAAAARLSTGRRHCPVGVEVSIACRETRTISSWLFWFSVSAFVIGGFFAFIAPILA